MWVDKQTGVPSDDDDDDGSGGEKVTLYHALKWFKRKSFGGYRHNH